MARDAAGKAVAVSKEDLNAMTPTVSVAEALDLPTDWSLKDSLGGVVKNNPTKVDTHTEEDDDALPAEADDESGDEGDAGKKKEDGEKQEAGEAAEKKPADKPVVSKKPLSKPKPGDAAVAKPGDKPAGTEKPATEKPAVVAPAKIKVGDKEYTQEELNELKKLLGVTEKPAAVAVPAKVEPAKKEPTPEEAEAQRVEVRKKDTEWVNNVAPNMDVAVDEPTLEKIITGGADAVKAFTQVLQSAVARAVLVTRKSMYAELEPRFTQLSAQQTPLMEAFDRQENERMWSDFQKDHPDLKDDRDLVEQAASHLATTEPERVAQLSEKEFYGECATGVRGLKTRFGSKVTPAVEGAPAPEKPAVVVADKPVVPPARSPVKPPGANLPAAKTPAGTGKKQGDSAIADLMEHDKLW